MADKVESGLFGDELKSEKVNPLSIPFLFQPTSVFDARTGEWQSRKRAWISLGIKSEVGRGDDLTYTGAAKSFDYYRVKEGTRESSDEQGTSIFDPVLCESIYRWFTAAGDQIVDPFSGGSVRGIVAGMMGRRYLGFDLRQDQVSANWDQSDEVFGQVRKVKISSASLNQKFHPCATDYIKSTCKGRCCQGTDGITVTVHPSEVDKFRDMGASIKGYFIVPDDRGLCPFKSDDGLCRIHDDKPFGCQASPFTLNKNGTMIVRNRYRLLRCYDCDGALPAYKSHAWSLARIFGESEANRISDHLDSGGGDIEVDMPSRNYAMVMDNDSAKSDLTRSSTRPVWVCGDSLNKMDDSPESDFVFSCPPYGDLERYSDDPNDLSAMQWGDFTNAYLGIITKAISRLKENRFACFVVGDFRDKRGLYHDFVSMTIDAFRIAGAYLYNEAILVTPVASASMRVTNQFNSGRKFCKVHQNVLVFCKGDPEIAASRLGQAVKGD